MSIGKAISMEDAIRKLMVVSESLEQYEDVESMSLSMLVSDCIDYLREKQLEKKWHTGTPTEEGWYFVAYKKRDCDGSYYWEYGARVWIEVIKGEGHWNECEEKHPVLAWQKIEPYKEKEDGHTNS